MEKPAFRRVRVIRTGDRPARFRRDEVVLVELPVRWAGAVASLIKLSAEYPDAGLLVTNVGALSHAAAAGMARGDVLLRCDDVPLESAESLRRLTRRGDAATEVTVEALRGTREMTFRVADGPLGITVSPLLHRFGAGRRSVRHGVEPETDRQQPPPIEEALVEVPGHLVAKVRLLKRLIEEPADAKQRKSVESLLATVDGLA